jgi:hypothetical protein
MDSIPLREHPMWPLFLSRGFASSADNLVPRNWGLPVKPPDAHDIYTFETRDGGQITWYCRSNLLALHDQLYYVYYDWELLSGYSWSHADYKRAERLIVKNTVLTSSFDCNGVLTLRGHNLHCARAIKMRPPVPWYSLGFDDALKTTYSQLDQINRNIVTLQRWARKIRRPNKKRLLLLACRHFGWFNVLPDDLFNMIVEEATKVFQMRQHQREFQQNHQNHQSIAE